MADRMEVKRILFLTASLAEGKDGVADYTLQLAKACTQQGHVCSLLAWNDMHLQSGIQIGSMSVSEQTISFLRLSNSLAPSSKLEEGARFVAAFSPDYVSIQMVCFGFHPRGWIFGLGNAFRSIIPTLARIEIMFHELWLGLATNHPWREKVLGWVQEMALRQFWTALSPAVVHAGNSVYYSRLSLEKLPVRYLPLPSNIPVRINTSTSWIYDELRMIPEERSRYVVLAFFGSLHAGWDIDAFFKKMGHVCEGKQVLVVSLGSLGNGAALWQQMQERKNAQLSFHQFGFRSDSEISALLQWSDIGICTTPLSLIGKSGTSMAMMEHGLPIVVTRNELVFPFSIQFVDQFATRIYFWEELQSYLPLEKVPPQPDRLHQIATSFLQDLSN